MDFIIPERFHEDDAAQFQSSFSEKNKAEYRSVKVYGSRAAACFNLTTYENKGKTINIEAAPIINKNVYDWKNKISLLVSGAELPKLICVLAGYHPYFEGKFHGPKKNKSFSLSSNKDGVLLALGEAGITHHVQIGASDLFYVLTNILTHIKDDYGDIGALDLLCLCKATTGRILNCSQNQNS